MSIKEIYGENITNILDYFDEFTDNGELISRNYLNNGETLEIRFSFDLEIINKLEKVNSRIKNLLDHENISTLPIYNNDYPNKITFWLRHID